MIPTKAFAERHIRALRKGGVAADVSAERAQLILRHCVPFRQLQNGMRDTGIAEFHIRYREDLSVPRYADLGLHSGGVVQPDAVEIFFDALSDDDPGGRFYALDVPGETAVIAVTRDAPRAVAAHFAE